MRIASRAGLRPGATKVVHQILSFLACATVAWVLINLWFLRIKFSVKDFLSSANGKAFIPTAAELLSDVSYRVHTFYYPWYCNPQVDGIYLHWNHQVLPHWEERVNRQYPAIGSKHDASKGDIGASFYPQLGLYSSVDKSVIDLHFRMIADAGIGVAVVSWLPKHQHDSNGPPIASLMAPILGAAARAGLRVAVHMEPYDQRTAESLRQDIKELLDEHGNSPALYRLPRPGNVKPLPVLYVYDQYRINATDFQQLLAETTPQLRGNPLNQNHVKTIRGSRYDAVLLALIVDEQHWNDYVVKGGFDGGYTYFASDTFTFGSRPINWPLMQQRSDRDQKYFIPCVGPGYDDTRIRPWNDANTKDRQGGQYFGRGWQAAIDAGARLVGITSFNEWHEGTQIEPAVPAVSTTDGWAYKDYENEGGPRSYLQLSKEWVAQFQSSRRA